MGQPLAQNCATKPLEIRPERNPVALRPALACYADDIGPRSIAFPTRTMAHGHRPRRRLLIALAYAVYVAGVLAASWMLARGGV